MKFPEISALYHQPLFDLISQSRAVHLQHWRGEEVQRCSLLSIKTGGWSGECAYFAPSPPYLNRGESAKKVFLEDVKALGAGGGGGKGETRFSVGGLGG